MLLNRTFLTMISSRLVLPKNPDCFRRKVPTELLQDVISDEATLTAEKSRRANQIARSSWFQYLVPGEERD